jgi:hypothetical protein
MSYRFLDAEIHLPRTAAQAWRLCALPLGLAALAALGAWAWWGRASMGVLLVALGAFVGAALRGLGVDVQRTPRAWWAAFGLVALLLALVLSWTLGRALR